jgi:hypothetical protein
MDHMTDAKSALRAQFSLAESAFTSEQRDASARFSEDVVYEVNLRLALHARQF